mmetsp:Transcript_176055/g.564500  ORF Transcript_176055/g.564500 Transcript_176055/m.564500 type:complete len:223 (+) Transcript_176055:1428-2096(+)
MAQYAQHGQHRSRPHHCAEWRPGLVDAAGCGIFRAGQLPRLLLSVQGCEAPRRETLSMRHHLAGPRFLGCRSDLCRPGLFHQWLGWRLHFVQLHVARHGGPHLHVDQHLHRRPPPAQTPAMPSVLGIRQGRVTYPLLARAFQHLRYGRSCRCHHDRLVHSDHHLSLRLLSGDPSPRRRRLGCATEGLGHLHMSLACLLHSEKQLHRCTLLVMQEAELVLHAG